MVFRHTWRKAIISEPNFNHVETIYRQRTHNTRHSIEQ